MICPVSSQLAGSLRFVSAPANRDKLNFTAVNRRVASSNLARGAKLSSLVFNHLEKIDLRHDCTRKVQLSEFCPSSHFAAVFFRAGNVVTLCCFGAVRK